MLSPSNVTVIFVLLQNGWKFLFLNFANLIVVHHFGGEYRFQCIDKCEQNRKDLNMNAATVYVKYLFFKLTNADSSFVASGFVISNVAITLNEQSTNAYEYC